MITNPTFHQKGRYFIPNSNNLSVRPEGVENSETSVQYFIDVYERGLLIDFLGIDLYNELVLIYPNIEDAVNIKWFNLVNGTNYIKDNKTYRFEGLKGFDKNSLISAFVYCKYLENDESYYSTTGTVKSDTGNASNYDPTRKYITVYFDFLEKYQNDTCSNTPSIHKIKGGYFVDYYNEEVNTSLVTLETYLKDHSADFEGYSFKRYETKNSLGI